MKILLIGGSGFLGRYFLKNATQNIKDIYRYRSNLRHYNTDENLIYAVENTRKIFHTAPNIQIVQGGISVITTDWLNKHKPDAVVHLARPSLPKFRRPGRIMAAFLANRYNSTLLHHLSRSQHKPPIIFASGTLNYGTGDTPVFEDAPLKPISYAKDYCRGEAPFLKALQSKNYPVKVLRFPWLLGSGSWFQWFYLETIKKHGYVPLFGPGQNKMSILDVRDAANMLLLHTSLQPFHQTYNVFGNPAIPQIQFAEQLAAVYNVPVKPFVGNLEKAALEAFTSNIIPDTLYPELHADYEFRTLNQSLLDIK